MTPSLLGFLARRGVGVQAVHYLCTSVDTNSLGADPRPGRHRLSRPARQLRTLSLTEYQF